MFTYTATLSLEFCGFVETARHVLQCGQTCSRFVSLRKLKAKKENCCSNKKRVKKHAYSYKIKANGRRITGVVLLHVETF